MTPEMISEADSTQLMECAAYHVHIAFASHGDGVCL